ncbi:hypothetical protein [Stenotrophomonas mori]|uniref:Lipoprotein n=1 Tax=Stenotrophomonas mori TaxID=2871096 RepID=A0ABT0SDT8_9GAMM|nr:hypothetical protein [Stenotrophomonas mori]MCL7713194.1 hypothetical protein [Stenotrophomonas mori]
MLKAMSGALVVLGLTACASSERLMDAGVRPAERPDCLVGGESSAAERAGGVRSLRDRRCHPDGELNWTVGPSKKAAMDVDFKKKND